MRHTRGEMIEPVMAEFRGLGRLEGTSKRD